MGRLEANLGACRKIVALYKSQKTAMNSELTNASIKI